MAAWPCGVLRRAVAGGSSGQRAAGAAVDVDCQDHGVRAARASRASDAAAACCCRAQRLTAARRTQARCRAHAAERCTEGCALRAWRTAKPPAAPLRATLRKCRARAQAQQSTRAAASGARLGAPPSGRRAPPALPPPQHDASPRTGPHYARSTMHFNEARLRCIATLIAARAAAYAARLLGAAARASTKRASHSAGAAARSGNAGVVRRRRRRRGPLHCACLCVVKRPARSWGCFRLRAQRPASPRWCRSGARGRAACHTRLGLSNWVTG